MKGNFGIQDISVVEIKWISMILKFTYLEINDKMVKMKFKMKHFIQNLQDCKSK